MRAIALTDVGKTRENNEDYYLMNKDLSLFIVSDGMGGYKAGEVAAEIASESIIQAFSRKSQINFEKEITDIFIEANESILAYVKAHPECRGMGTTSVVAYIEKDVLWIANVGDSRCYALQEGKLIQLSEDHSLVAELVKIGSISPEEAEIHPDRNIITSALGVDRKFEITIKKYALDLFTHLVLCSDGLSNMVSSKEQEDIFKRVPFEGIPKALVNLANENGGKDNITIICIEL
jgi:PPM family protein phosphatase